MNAVTEQRKVLLEIADLKVHFDIKDGKQWFWQPSKTLKAVDGVTLRLYEGETLGVVGESGCGKSTFARAIIGLVKATDGKVAWLGKDLLGMKQEEWRDVRSDIQMIFQDPLASLNPRMTIGEIIAEPLRTNPPSGCVFRTRCPLAGPECAKTRPVLEGSFRHAVSCLKVDPL